MNEPVNGHAEGYNDWSLIFPRGIEDIDVLKGPTSALFGNFALSGVVNVRTLERMHGTELSADGGAYGRAGLTMLTGFDHGTAGGGVMGLRVQREDGFRPNARNGLLQGHARLVRDVGPGATIDGGVELYGANWDSPGYISDEEFAAGDYHIVSNVTDGGYKRRAQERLSYRVITSSLLWRTRRTQRRAAGNSSSPYRPPAGGSKEPEPDGGGGSALRLRAHQRAHVDAPAWRHHVRHRDALGSLRLPGLVHDRPAAGFIAGAAGRTPAGGALFLQSQRDWGLASVWTPG